VQALEFIGGFCLTKDMAKGNQLGPYLVTPDEVGDPYNLKVTVVVNGHVKYQGSTSEISHKAEDAFAWLGFMAPPKPGSVMGLGTIPDCTGLDHDDFIDPGAEIQITFERSGRSAAGLPNRRASCCRAAGRCANRCRSTISSPQLSSPIALEVAGYAAGRIAIRPWAWQHAGIFGPEIDSALQGLAATSPDLARCLVEFPFGDIYPAPVWM